MNRSPLCWLLAAVCGLAWACGAAPEPGDAQPAPVNPPPRFAPLVATFESERVALGAPAAALAILEHGQVSFSAGFGSRRPGADDPVRATTLFRIGSMTKMLTAAGLMQQVAAGKLDVAQPITAYVPGLKLARDPTWAPSIQVRHLLTHSSGLLDYLQLDWPLRDDSQLGGFLTGPAFAGIEYLMAPAGRMWNYSNPNFMLAGLALERVGGSPYRAYLRERLFLPLGMTRTTFLPAEVMADGDFAFGQSQGRSVAPGDYDNPWGRPAGYAFSSALELARFARFLLDGDPAVLPDAQRRELFARQIDTATYLDLAWYGYGLFVEDGFPLGRDFYRETLVQHGGDILGFAADLVAVPRTGFAIVILAGADGAHFQKSVVQALQLFAGLPPPTPPPDTSFAPGDYDLYAGDYLDPFNVGPVKIARSADKLTLTMPSLDAARIPYDRELAPAVRHNFVLKIQGTSAALTFILNAQGKVEYVRTRFAVARRVTPMMLAREKQPVLDREALARALASGPRLLVPPVAP